LLFSGAQYEISTVGALSPTEGIEGSPHRMYLAKSGMLRGDVLRQMAREIIDEGSHGRN